MANSHSTIASLHGDGNLFTPLQLGPHTLANRIVMAPMTRNRAGDGNAPQAMNIDYYAQRASAGLIITEGSQVSPQGVGYPHTPGIHNPAQVAGWRRVTQAVHERGGKIFLQLWHVGRISHRSLQPAGALPVAPSALAASGDAMTYSGPRPFETPRALSVHELSGIVEQFRHAARNAQVAGFDGVEIHAANGYLLDQFLRDGSNHRDDRYGGPPENRARLTLQVAAAVADEIGAERVGIRISPLNAFNSMSDSHPEQIFGYLTERLNQYGLAYLHVVEAHDPAAGPGFDTDLLRSLFQGMYIVNGGYDRARGDAAIASGRADLVSFGIPFLANPDLSERLRRNAALNEPDRSTFYGGNRHGYTDYPFLTEVEDELAESV